MRVWPCLLGLALIGCVDTFPPMPGPLGVEPFPDAGPRPGDASPFGQVEQDQGFTGPPRDAFVGAADRGRPPPPVDASPPPPRDRGAPPPPPRDRGAPPPPPEDASVPTAPPPPPDVIGPVPGQIVINEVDYNQPGEDRGEFVELLVLGDRPVSLAGVRLELYSASDSARVRCAGFAPAPNGPSRYGCAELPPEVVEPGDYIVLTALGEGPRVPPGTLRFEVLGANQGNGVLENSTEGVLLLGPGEVVLDGFAWEGEIDGVGEGLAPEGEDSDSASHEGDPRPEHAFGRCPDGRDTDDNASDFELLTPPTAGFDNACR